MSAAVASTVVRAAQKACKHWVSRQLRKGMMILGMRLFFSFLVAHRIFALLSFRTLMIYNTLHTQPHKSPALTVSVATVFRESACVECFDPIRISQTLPSVNSYVDQKALDNTSAFKLDPKHEQPMGTWTSEQIRDAVDQHVMLTWAPGKVCIYNLSPYLSIPMKILALIASTHLTSLPSLKKCHWCTTFPCGDFMRSCLYLKGSSQCANHHSWRWGLCVR